MKSIGRTSSRYMQYMRLFRTPWPSSGPYEFLIVLWLMPAIKTMMIFTIKASIFFTVGMQMISLLQPLSHHQNVANLSLFYHYFYWRYSDQHFIGCTFLVKIHLFSQANSIHSFWMLESSWLMCWSATL